MNISVDPGTYELRVATGDKVLTRDRMLIAIRRGRREVVATGTLAVRLLGRSSPDIQFSEPIQREILHEPELFTQLLKDVLQRSLNWSRRLFLSAVVGLSPVATEAEREALLEAVLGAGIGKVEFRDLSLAAFVACRGSTANQRTNDVMLEIGHDSSRLTVLWAGQTVFCRHLEVGGRDFTSSTKRAVKSECGLEISSQRAELLKAELDEEGLDLPVWGRGPDGLVQRSVVTSSHLRQAYLPYLEQLRDGLTSLIRDFPLGTTSDLWRSGLSVTGGGSRLFGLPQFLKESFDFPVHCHSAPEQSAVLGLLKSRS